jgi:uncharacterized protein (UPF0333 family)
MASRHARIATLGEYQFQHITGTGTNVPVGAAVGTASATTITAGSVQAVTPTTMKNIVPGMMLNFAGGTGTAEDVLVISTTSTTLTANFVNAHSGAYTISSHRGCFVGPLIVGNPGTSTVLTLYNGHPSASPAGVVIAIISVAATATSYPFQGSCDQGLFYTLSGTPGDLTLQYLDHSA